MGVIGVTLSEARTKRAVDLEEVEAATGIRTRYLRAIEAEDWDALPEEVYARAFIRKYAQFLGVEPEPLVEEYRQQRGAGGHGGEAPTSPFARTSSRRAEALRRRRKRQAVYVWLGAGAVLAAIVLVIVLLVSGGGSGMKEARSGAGGKGANAAAGKAGESQGGGGGQAAAGTSHRSSKRAEVTLKIESTGEVWACVENAKGNPLVDGLILATGETVGPFHSSAYTAAFGNGSVAISVDGKAVNTPSTPSPMGFTVDSSAKVHELPEGERPSCE